MGNLYAIYSKQKFFIQPVWPGTSNLKALSIHTLEQEMLDCRELWEHATTINLYFKKPIHLDYFLSYILIIIFLTPSTTFLKPYTGMQFRRVQTEGSTKSAFVQGTVKCT